MKKIFSKSIRIAVLAFVAGIVGSEVFAQTGPYTPAPAVPYNYWHNRWLWYDNTYRPDYPFEYRWQPRMGFWQGYAGPPSVNRSSVRFRPLRGTFYQGGGYRSGLFQRPMPYGWW